MTAKLVKSQSGFILPIDPPGLCWTLTAIVGILILSLEQKSMGMLPQKAQHLNLPPAATAKQQEDDPYLPNLRWVHLAGGTYFVLRTLAARIFNFSRQQRIWSNQANGEVYFGGWTLRNTTQLTEATIETCEQPQRLHWLFTYFLSTPNSPHLPLQHTSLSAPQTHTLESCCCSCDSANCASQNPLPGGSLGSAKGMP